MAHCVFHWTEKSEATKVLIDYYNMTENQFSNSNSDIGEEYSTLSYLTSKVSFTKALTHVDTQQHG